MDSISIKLGFTSEELLARRKFIGGSDANILMSGDDDAIHDLWLRKTGQAEEPDLSDVLPVQFGIWTEPLNVKWFERTTGRAVRSRNLLCPHAHRHFMAANIDGLTATDDGEPALFEAKCVNAFSNIVDTEQKYMAQLHHGMYCTDTKYAILSVFVGTLKYELAEVALDEFYLAQLIDREIAFWHCVERFEPPPRMKPIAGPLTISAFRTVDLTGSNEWAAHAGIWLETREHAKRFEGAAKAIKALVEPDVGKASGYGIVCTRSKSGALSIKEGK